ncbi:glycosyltransferase family protein [Pseudochryseolinea flava]|uniref:Glycosyl transferase family 1 domain-containing protein n=1 Tax=Pseudochryseolinea flava TaxID=2059302 RepID=A0A364XUJ3_9BACT|nr:hypothetical protein [Pseudochryseolinea flava]RAV97841.1 hypothetical protein DQQ10_26615 [Pseudochryseolinea flava]
MRRKVLLVEFKYHQEIIPSQLMLLLDAGYDVHVFLDKNLWDEQLLGVFKDRVSFTLLHDTKKIFRKIAAIFQLRKYVRKHGISHLVINTLDSNFNYYVLKFLPGLHAVGIVHQVHRFVKKQSHRKSLNKVNAVATLSDYTLDYFRKHIVLKVESAFFYPIYFETKYQATTKTRAEVTVVVPGQLDLRKRDYFQLIAAVERMPKLEGVKFILLGNKNKNDGKAVVATIESKGLSKYFVLSEGFLPYDQFFQYIASCDYVMPLLSDNISNYRQYLQSQISASFNWGYAFNKKLLLHIDFSQVVKRVDAVFYDNDTLSNVLSQLKKEDTSMVRSEYFDFKKQQEAYLSLFGT